MKKNILLGLTCILVAGLQMAVAQEVSISRIIPFTGTDYVKVEATVPASLPLSDYQCNAVIRAADGGNILWQGAVVMQPYEDAGIHHFSFIINKLSPVLWSPVNPYLYLITVQLMKNNKVVTEITERTGFRSFEAKGGQLYLNGKPVFLRGIAINPPGRGIPDSLNESRRFAMDYVRFMKSIHVNIIRLQTYSKTWFDVCDEMGMMLFGGNYGGSVNGQQPPANYDSAVVWYKEDKFAPLAHHPSLMVYALVNEAPFRGALASRWEKFLAYASKEMLKWDNTRTYIANAGYGYGKSGDICDIHRYWGWYYASPFTFIHVRDNKKIIPFPKKVQPVTFTECVGNYTGPDGMYNLSPNHKNPGSQLNWTGHAPEAMQARLANEHQCYTFKQATELFRCLRVINPELSGLFPFTILFYNWNTIGNFVDMDPKPVTLQARMSYSPILVSWECWTPNAYAGAALKPIVHIVNDDDGFADLSGAKLIYQIVDNTQSVVAADSTDLPLIKYYDTWQRQLDIKIPANLKEGKYQLKGSVVRNGELVSENYFDLYIVSEGLPVMANAKSSVLLYDPVGTTARAFTLLGRSFTRVTAIGTLPVGSLLVIGENAADVKLMKSAAAIQQFVKGGGRMIGLRQDSVHLNNFNALLNKPVKVVTVELDDPTYPPAPRPSVDGYYVNPEDDQHPVFAGIGREQLKVWSDYTGWNESKPGFPAIYPVTNGYIVKDKNDLAATRILADYGPGLEGIAIAEIHNGKGSVLLTGFDLVHRTGIDPMADRLLMNILNYMSAKEGHEVYKLVDRPIIWGNYASENGLLTGINSGLIVNGKPRLIGSYKDIPLVINAEGDEFAGKPGGWNDRPGLQYVAYGRRPFGPYHLPGLGTPRPLDVTTTIGEGNFWCSIPPGKKEASTIVWNPDVTDLAIEVTVNGQHVSHTIKAGETATVNCPVAATNVQMKFRGDRKLVLLQTEFK